MTTTFAATGALLRRRRKEETRATVAVAVLAMSLGVAAAAASQIYGFAAAAPPALGAALCLWLLAAARPRLALVVLLGYLTLLDGVLRLRTGNQALTAVRDVFLYAVAGGLLARHVMRGGRLRLPPLGVGLVLLTGLVAVQFVNPHSGTFLYSLASARSHLEWIPLFFIGYAFMRDERTLRLFLVLLLTVTAINGFVGFLQFNLSVEELSRWGPGYAEEIAGDERGGRRVYYDQNEEPRTRPFGLGGDIGFPGYLGMLALPALLAAYSTGRRRQWWLMAPLAVGVVLAIVTSQTRSAVVGAVIALIAFLFLSGRLQRARTAKSVLVAAVAVGTVVYGLASTAKDYTFVRYETIRPDRIATTAYESRGFSLGRLPEYLKAYPLGAGLGSHGPAAAHAVGGDAPLAGTLDAENEFNFLLIELGIPGVLLFLWLTVRLLTMAWRRLKEIHSRETAVLLAAIAAPLFALLASWIGFAVTAKPPTAPYFWFAAGVLVYWLGRTPERSMAGGDAAVTSRPGRSRPAPAVGGRTGA